MSVTVGQFHKEEYKIGGKPVVVLADFNELTVKIMSRGFNQTYSMEEYENFDGNMKDFAREKIDAHN